MTLAVPSLRRNFLHMLVGNVSTAGMQALQFVILARILGPIEFGTFSAILAVVLVIQPLAGLGYSTALVLYSSKHRDVLPVMLGNSLLVTFALAIIIIIVGVPIAWLTTAENSKVWLIFMYLALAELLFVKLGECFSNAFVAIEKLFFTSVTTTLFSFTRLIFVAISLFIFDGLTAEKWAQYYLLANAIAFAGALTFCLRNLPPPRIDKVVMQDTFGDAISFCISTMARGAYIDAEKPILARFAGAEVVGIYTAASRLVFMAIMPIRALSFSTQSRLFRSGNKDTDPLKGFGFTLLKTTFLYGLFTSVVLYMMAPLLPIVLGSRYEESIPVLQAMAGLPLLFGLQNILVDILATHGMQKIRAIFQIIAAITFITLNFFLVPAVGWMGAVISSYITQLCLIVAMLFTLKTK